jgi:hypothetical protein
MVMYPLIYTLALLLLGLRVLELNAGLAPPWHNLAQVAIAIGMWSVLMAWFRIECKPAEQVKEAQAIPT